MAGKRPLSREVSYLRMSITDRCNLRCTYCTAWGSWEKLPAPEILRYEELLKVAAVGARVGLRKVRVTGGEPLMRRGVVDFIQGLHHLNGLAEVCLTTNGVLLKDMAAALYATGLRHLNLSLDTLRRSRFLTLTGSDNFLEVQAGLEQAAALGFSPLKINFVVLKGLNDDELLDFALLARDHPFQVRFIEFMPTVSQEHWARHFLPMAVVRRRLKVLGLAEPREPEATAGPARLCRPPGFKGELGFISSVSQHHCLTCNRLRLTAAGQLRPCLLAPQQLDLKGPLRQGASDEELGSLLKEAMALKTQQPEDHTLNATLPPRAMVSIGG